MSAGWFNQRYGLQVAMECHDHDYHRDLAIALTGN